MASFDKPRHVKYWRRCFTSHLPSAYTANDSTRLTFAFFIVSALDLLAVPFTPEDRSAVRSWVLSLQHPDGGFCGSPTHGLSGQDATKGSANLATTFFALLLLAVAAGTDNEASAAFAGVQRRKLLRWVKKLQRQDGSFGQVLWEHEAVGGRDTRHSYLASAIRWMLWAREDTEDIDVESMVDHIRHTQTYDGGAAEVSEHESHGMQDSALLDPEQRLMKAAGYAYCAVAALYMLDRPASSTVPHRSEAAHEGVPDRDALIHFLVHRQFNYLAKQEEEESDDGDANYVQARLGDLSLTDRGPHVGFNGRWNKKADTCYCWWVSGTLAMVDSIHAVNIAPSRQYLLDVSQHRIGGFSKHAGGPPDLYHSYLGLAALALMGEAGLKEFDVGLCCSKETVRKIELARAGLLGAKTSGFGDDGFWESINRVV
ncbi:geranylgeranyl transferase type I beta subunit [Metarhizium album ARSEF 1941]|uniref:Geranylgeranyl transferase type I beta subunit n=1 Tax=Metarhizium album (strain ARSEF 1941) TaxID=1081103 RepID=A0A0B2WQW1_METAS|nr:geranylgeranyl transferase type I beta subunit [Metarhizium album ARSEF 1941]KHN96019.1 geranylgeranyl transferase type I beta subunit [Metarhizium album ARSEF 1941]